MNSLRVWDLAVRLFHWALLILVVISVTTGLTGGNAMAWHVRSGTLILGLLLFRWCWGFIGSTTARFVDFLHGPRRVFEFTCDLLRNRQALVAGHNPLGGWMVLFMLLSLTLQAITGLFADDEIFTTGPLAHLVSGSTISLLTSIHDINAWIVISLVTVHVAAVLFHLVVRRENLMSPMITGRKSWPEDMPRPMLRFTPAWGAALLFLFTLGTVFATLSLLGN
ncbi:MAG: cytochrome B [Gammaproteobacteria bacterium]|nr:MAG: cytochrome B [Gammaproteobacteria bacterium]